MLPTSFAISLLSKWSYKSIINYQTVRWRRKPRWLPVAKSKQFRVPERTVIPIEEKLELLRLNNNYKTQERAVRKYLIKEVKKEVSGENITHMSPEEELEDHNECAKLNEIWNREIAESRNKRLVELAKNCEDLIIKQIKMKNESKLKQMEEATEKLRLLKEQSKLFITPTNIDSAIEEALTNTVDYNFSIDTEGNIFKGRTSPVLGTAS